MTDRLCTLERKLLRSILHAKFNTPDELIYLELGRPDIVAVTKQLQHGFYKKLLSLSVDEAISRKLVSKFQNLPIIQYYDQVKPDVASANKDQKLTRTMNSVSTYHLRYRSLINLKLNHVIYDGFLPEALRIIITRWRLSNHKLRIESDRYVHPKPHRNMRVCRRCGVVEDESHAIYDCPIFACVRNRFANFLERYTSIEQVLNPKSVEDAVTLGNFLLNIEKKMKE